MLLVSDFAYCYVRPLRYRDYMSWNSLKIISHLVSVGCSLSADPNITHLPQWNAPKFWPKVTHPLLIWASQELDGKLRPNAGLETAQWSQWRFYRKAPSLFWMLRTIDDPLRPLLPQMDVSNAPVVMCRISNGHISATGDPIRFSLVLG